MFNKIKYWYWRKYKHIPHVDEILDLYSKAMPRSVLHKNKHRWAQMVLDYMWATPINEIAEEYGVTRERVRQCIWKAYRVWRKDLNKLME